MTIIFSYHSDVNLVVTAAFGIIVVFCLGSAIIASIASQFLWGGGYRKTNPKEPMPPNLLSRRPDEAQRNPGIGGTTGYSPRYILQKTNNHFRRNLLA